MMKRLTKNSIFLACVFGVTPILAQTSPARNASPVSPNKKNDFSEISFKVNPETQIIASDGLPSSFVLGVPSTHQTFATPRASLKLQTSFHGSQRIRRLLKINGRDSTKVFMRFDLDNLGANEPAKPFATKKNPDKLHYGPSFGLQVAVTPKLTIEAEYSPLFGGASKESTPRASTAKERLKNRFDKISRVDEFRVRLNVNFGTQ